MQKKQAVSLLTILVFTVLIPATLLICTLFLDNRRYYITGVLVVIEALIPFFADFERSKPQAREIVLISTLAALAAAGRAAFFWVPQFKPILAIIIIAGITLGAKNGFIVGALAFLISNFIFGQGPWTAWQMFCGGMVGFIAGLIFYNRDFLKKRIPLAIYGFLATFLIYGGIINLNTLFMTGDSYTLGMVLAVYLSAAPFDLIHSLSSAVFLFILSKPMLAKLDRIKAKYGIIDT